jgi:hypothetical protein
MGDWLRLRRALHRAEFHHAAAAHRKDLLHQTRGKRNEQLKRDLPWERHLEEQHPPCGLALGGGPSAQAYRSWASGTGDSLGPMFRRPF